MKNILLAISALALGFAVGLAYAWLIAPVKYVDASPDLLRADFKDQYRIVVAASYASSHDLARARARLELLGADPLGDVNAQAQRMVGTGDPASVELLVKLASDLQKGVAEIPPTSTFAPTSTNLPTMTASLTMEPTETLTSTPTLEPTPTATLPEGSTPLAPPEYTPTPEPTSTPTRVVADNNSSKLFVLVDQEEVCDSRVQPGLMQIKLVDNRRRQMAGIEIVVISVEGEDHFYTGFKPEVGDGYADFVMKENVSYSVRIGEGGTFLANLSAPICTDPNGIKTLGGLSLSFQQP